MFVTLPISCYISVDNNLLASMFMTELHHGYNNFVLGTQPSHRTWTSAHFGPITISERSLDQLGTT
jgi:hypothetical protein